jgi:hypothetical protein
LERKVSYKNGNALEKDHTLYFHAADERTTALKSLKGPEREEGQVKLTQR